MQHTYLRYECADSFGLITSSASSKAPLSNSILAFGSASRNRPVLLTTAGSYSMGFHLRTTEPTIKIGHRAQLTGGVGTGRGLNSDQIVCLDVAIPEHDGSCKVATGWVDGAVRVFDISSDEMQSDKGCGLIQSLLQDSNEQEDYVMREPLVLNGHSGSPVRSVVFDSKDASRLASGSSDGSVVLWDIVAETGLFRLLGHKGGITDISFVTLKAGVLDVLITSSLDGLVKVWDLEGQCCIQTIPTHRGEVWGAACLTIPGSNPLGSDVDVTDDNRIRLVTGSSDGQARVWSVQTPKRYENENKGEDEGDDTKVAVVADAEVAVVADGGEMESVDDVCHYMGTLIPPPNVSTSSERIACIHFHPNGKYVGVLHANSKNVDVYLIRSVQESLRKKQRRLRRRKEKSKLSVKNQESGTKGQKRGMLDDPESEDEKAEGTEKLSLDQTLSPEQIKASDEFEYFETARASHKVKGFIFVPYKEQGGGVRVVCSLSTNALEVHSLTRKAARLVTLMTRENLVTCMPF
jgi:WD40 repeat protein